MSMTLAGSLNGHHTDDKDAPPEPRSGPPSSADLATCWKFLETGCNRIMLYMHAGMTYSWYMLLYTACYNYCVMNRPQDASAAGYPNQRSGASLMGSDLYTKLTAYFQNHCRRLGAQAETMSDLALLRFYASEWDKYTIGAGYVNRLFTYLNRHWVKREKDEGRKGVYPVYTLALVQWKEYFFLHMQKKQNRLIQAVLKQIQNQRDGEEIDTSLIKKVIDSLVALGLDEAETGSRSTLDVYKEHFQLPFIQATEAYYRAESEAFVAENSISDYLKKAEARLLQEEARVERYLHSSSRKSLMLRSENVLITEHLPRMQEEFQGLLDADRSEDLGRMWDLLNRVPGGLEPLRERFEQHVKASGLEAVQKVSGGTVNAEGKAEAMDPKSYVEALLAVHRKNSGVVEQSFRGEQGFTAALDKACRAYCNHNSVATTTHKSPELLAAYVDSLLKKTNKDSGDASMEDSLNDCMTIFKYIDDRDVFQKFYAKNLANRLVRQLSASDEAEGSMLSKLKETCGFEYTSKLQKMITDVNLSRDLTDKYKEKMRQTHSAEELDIDFSIIIGGMNNWPLQAQATEFTIPRDLVPVHARFGGFYQQAHTGRKLTWLWHLSKCEIRMNWTSPKYILMASAYQMAILLLFNEDLSLTQSEIEKATRIAPAQLNPVLNLLVKAKVLLQDGDTFDLNTNFKSKKIRVNINQMIRSEQKAEASEVMKTVDEDRKFVYQAMIVRVMKSRKTMRHAALLQEVTGLLASMFTPKVSEMKKAIDHLLDKEYLERVEGSKDQYNYLA